MPVVVNYDGDFAAHEDAERWEYQDVGDGGPYILKLLDGDGVRMNVEIPVQNLQQVQHMSEAEYQELAEML